MPTFGSLFAGIGGFDLGLEAAGFECRWQVEFDETCTKVLSHQWPNVLRHGDVSKVKGEDLERVDLIVGGWPCQDLSLAGRRAGLAGERSGLFYQFMRIVDEVSPQWILAENVPGLLSAKSDGEPISFNGGAMGAVIGALAERGYGYAWRVLDAQFFGLAQRRRRVFIVGHLGTPWSAPAEVLFEPESLCGNPPTRSEARSNATPRSRRSPSGDSGVVAALTSTGVGTCGADDNQAQAGHLIVPDVSGTLGGGSGDRGWSDDLDRAGAFVGYRDASVYSVYPESGQGADIRATQVEVAPTLTGTAEAASTDRGTRVVQSKVVRRLTPTECLRLQGFPDDWLEQPHKQIADSKRYKMIGNAVAPPCARWIGHRLMKIMQGEDPNGKA